MFWSTCADILHRGFLKAPRWCRRKANYMLYCTLKVKITEGIGQIVKLHGLLTRLHAHASLRAVFSEAIAPGRCSEDNFGSPWVTGWFINPNQAWVDHIRNPSRRQSSQVNVQWWDLNQVTLLGKMMERNHLTLPAEHQKYNNNKNYQLIKMHRVPSKVMKVGFWVWMYFYNFGNQMR